jgi:hypothetical protein
MQCLFHTFRSNRQPALFRLADGSSLNTVPEADPALVVNEATDGTPRVSDVVSAQSLQWQLGGLPVELPDPLAAVINRRRPITMDEALCEIRIVVHLADGTERELVKPEKDCRIVVVMNVYCN